MNKTFQKLMNKKTEVPEQPSINVEQLLQNLDAFEKNVCVGHQSIYAALVVHQKQIGMLKQMVWGMAALVIVMFVMLVVKGVI